MYEVTLSGTKYHIADHMMDSIERYVEHGTIPGDFLQAVICNDLAQAFWRADDENLANLQAFVHYFFNITDSRCWGTVDKMNAWAERKREEREDEAT